MTKVWIVGSSHVGAINRARRDLGIKWDGMDILGLSASRSTKTGFHSVEHGRLRFLDEQIQQTATTFRNSMQVGELDAVAVYLGDANQSLLVHSSFWSSSEPYAVLEEGRIPVPESMIRAIVDSEAQAACAFMVDLKKLGQTVYWITYPAIKVHHPMFESGVRTDVVRYIDDLFISRMGSHLKDHDIAVIKRPPESLTEEGLLKREYSQDSSPDGSPDWVHANAQYGALLLNEIRATIRA